MSLLMDALKKAEQEKREAAKKLLSSDDTAMLQTEAVAATAEPPPAVSADATGEMPAVSNNPADKTYQRAAMDFSLAPIELKSATQVLEQQPERSASDADYSEEPTLNVTLSDLSMQKERASSPELTVEQDLKTTDIKPAFAQPEVQLDPDQTFHGLEMEKAAISGLYEDTIQGEAYKPADISRSYDETLPGVPAAQLARDIGTQDQPTPVAAQTVFAATQTVAKPSSGFRWLLISLCVLAIGSSAVFYYYSVTPVARDIPSPMVARGVETVIHGQDLQSLLPPDVVAVADSMDITGASDPVEVIEGSLADTDPDTVSENITADSTPDLAGTETARTEQQQTTVASSPPAEATPAPVYTPPPVMEASPALIKISRSMQPADEGRLVNEAFAAYQRGDLDLAKSRYEQAYMQSPANRDVLLGLAAIASKNGDTSTAMQLYTQLVRLNPLDNVARAALLAFEQGENIPESISAVKSMLYSSPEQPSLHFALGKLYAADSRWSEAQQAFFDAYTLDSSNPDYALNLAISLDRMGQSQSALDYYNAALQLSVNTPAGFDTAVVSDRISTLEARE